MVIESFLFISNRLKTNDEYNHSAFHRPVQYVTEDCYPEDPLDNVPLSVHLMENCATVDDSNEISDTVEPLFTSESANNVSNHDVVNGTRTISMKRKQPTPTAVKQCKQLLLNKIGRLEVPNNRIVTDTTEDSSPRPPSPQNHDLDVSIIKQEELDVIELESSGSYDQDHGANDDDGTNGDFYTGSFENQLFETLSDYFELSPQHLRLTQSKTQTTSAHLNAMINENPSTSSSNGLENDQMNRMIRPVITPVIEMFHDCTFCTHRFKDADILRIHVRAVHLTCDICGAILNSSSELLQHKETVHDRIKYYFCGKCSFSSYSTESLHLHMRVHSNQRTFNCSKCATTFSRKHLLNKHIVNTISCQPDQPSK